MIVKSKEEDISRLIEIWESAVLATHDFLSKEDFLFFRLNMPIFLKSVSLFHSVNDEGVINGFLGVSEDNIEMLFIDNDVRGQGIGKLLAGYAIDELKCSKVDVNEQNIQAVGFYRHIGFKEISRDSQDGFDKPYPILHLGL